MDERGGELSPLPSSPPLEVDVSEGVSYVETNSGSQGSSDESTPDGQRSSDAFSVVAAPKVLYRESRHRQLLCLCASVMPLALRAVSGAR